MVGWRRFHAKLGLEQTGATPSTMGWRALDSGLGGDSKSNLWYHKAGNCSNCCLSCSSKLLQQSTVHCFHQFTKHSILHNSIGLMFSGFELLSNIHIPVEFQVNQSNQL